LGDGFFGHHIKSLKSKLSGLKTLSFFRKKEKVVEVVDKKEKVVDVVPEPPVVPAAPAA
jgi:hypothetical protein